MLNRQYTVGLYTLGCKVSQYETEAIAEDFARRGFLIRPFEEVCDVYVINTCTVTAESDRKCRQIIRRAVQTNPCARVLVCGCYAQTSPDALLRIPGVSYVGGTDGKMKLAEAARDLLAAAPAAPVSATHSLTGIPFEPMSITRAPRTRAYIKIEDGCECRCSYCAIPGARGDVRSKSAEDILAEVSVLAAVGSREIVLTGIETASWGVDLGSDRLIDLLEMLDARPDTPRIRLGSLAPECIRPDFIKRFAALRHVVPHLHLSMQSGSDAVLRRMRRRYLSGQAEEALAALRAAVPRICFTTDMMVGFPGETEENFAETLAFAERAAFLDMHVFAYSRRPGTPAADYPGQVPADVKHARSAALLAARDRIRRTLLTEICQSGTPLSVLIETYDGSTAVGHSDNFIEVYIPTGKDLRGEIVTVTLCEVGDGFLIGRPIS